MARGLPQSSAASRRRQLPPGGSLKTAISSLGPLREGARQVVKSSATLFRDKIEWREIIQTFTRTGIDEMNNSNKLLFRNE